jgi:hypothetical protein
MLDRLTVDDFTGYRNAMFRIHLDSRETLDLELIEAKPVGAPQEVERPGLRRQPFSLVFRGPNNPLLSQQIYPVEHPVLGTLGIFLVPLGPEGDPKGLHYQAIFN